MRQYCQVCDNTRQYPLNRQAPDTHWYPKPGRFRITGTFP